MYTKLEFFIIFLLFFLTGGSLLPLIDPTFLCFFLFFIVDNLFFEKSLTFFFFLIFLFFLKKCFFKITLLFVDIFIESLLTVIFLLIPVAVYSLLERKIIALVQRRKGPNLIGLWGLLQFLIDGLKLFLKEIITPTRVNSVWFMCSPILAASLSFSAWFFLPIHPVLCFPNSHLDLLILLTISSLNVYTTVLAGWSSNSRYAFLGSLRAIAQIISYELPMLFCLMPIVAFTNSLSIKVIVFSQAQNFFLWFFMPSAIIFLICIIAETNRAPFDLPEAESELVSGYNTEYSSLIFAFFFISEYANMLLMSCLWINIFWGGWFPLLNFLSFIPANITFSIKLCFLSFLFIYTRANLPRYRYDQLMNFGWKVLLPVSFSFFILCLSIMFFFTFFFRT